MSPTPKEERSAGKATGGVEEIKCGPLNRFGSNKESDPMGTSSVDDQMASCSLAQPNINDKFLSPTKRTHDYNAKLTDLAAHLSNRRSSCSSLPGIRESRVEETEQEASAYASPSFALLGVRTRSQERSNSFCMPLPKRHLLLGRGTLFHENENYSDGDEDASKPFGLSPLIQSSNPSSGSPSVDLLEVKDSDGGPEGSSRVQSSRTWPQSAIRSACAIHESVLAAGDDSPSSKTSTYCGSLTQIPKISVSQEDVGEAIQ